MNKSDASPVDVNRNTVVAKALLNAAEGLGLNGKVLAEVIGVSEATLTRLKKNEATLERKSYELSLYVIRLFRSLDAIVHGDTAARQSWMTSYNTVLKNKPIDLIKKINGIILTCDYLDSRRSPI